MACVIILSKERSAFSGDSNSQRVEGGQVQHDWWQGALSLCSPASLPVYPSSAPLLLITACCCSPTSVSTFSHLGTPNFVAKGARSSFYTSEDRARSLQQLRRDHFIDYAAFLTERFEFRCLPIPRNLYGRHGQTTVQGPFAAMLP